MIMIPPREIMKYVGLDEDGKWIHDPNMPEELQPVFEQFLEKWKESRKYKKEF